MNIINCNKLTSFPGELSHDFAGPTDKEEKLCAVFQTWLSFTGKCERSQAVNKVNSAVNSQPLWPIKNPVTEEMQTGCMLRESTGVTQWKWPSRELQDSSH